MSTTTIIRQLDCQPYTEIWQTMKAFTHQRTADTQDEIWLLQHPPVFTQGQAGKTEHIINPGIIPVVQSDRGGQITYHGPGQIVAYILLNLKRVKLGIRQLVMQLEQAVINLLDDYAIKAKAKRDAPGVYVGDAKICSLGLRVSKSCSYHGLALNADMDLSPFQRINPCGFRQLLMTQIKDHISTTIDFELLQKQLVMHICQSLKLTSAQDVLHSL